jgi:hypothetical protein
VVEGQPANGRVTRTVVALPLVAVLLLFAPLDALGGAPLTQVAATLRAGPLGLDDYFQDWAAGRNALDGRSIYEPLDVLARRHAGALGRSFESTEHYDGLPVNAHPPFAILLLLPASLLDYTTAWLPFTCLNLFGVLAAVPLWLWALRPPTRGDRAATQLLVHLALITTSFPFVFQIAVGNLEGILLLCLSAAFALEARDRRVPAGVLVGVAGLIKVWPWVFALPMLLARRRAQAAAVGATVAVGTAATVAAFGWADHRRFLEVAAAGAARWSGSPTNLSLPSTIRRWFAGFERAGWPSVDAVLPAAAPLSSGLALLVSAALVAGVALAILRHPRDRTRAVCLVLLLALLVSPMTWPHSLLLAWPAVAWLWSRREGAGGRHGAVLVAGCALLWCDERALWATVSGAPVWPERFSALASATLLSADTVGLLLLLACATIRREHSVPPADQPAP